MMLPRSVQSHLLGKFYRVIPNMCCMMMSSSDTADQRRLTGDSDLARKDRGAARFWGSLVIGLLGTQVLIGVGSIIIATGDPSAAVVPDYYQKALNWDEERASQAASDALGWQTEITVSDGVDRTGRRTLLVRLLDRGGQAVEDATVSARLYHHARAAQSQTVQFRDRGNGYYTAVPAMGRAGLWQMELTAVPSDDDTTFLKSQTVRAGLATVPKAETGSAPGTARSIQ